jgi:hypothetical protein
MTLPRERYAGQVERARAAGLSLPTIESVKQGCYSDEQLSALIHDLAVRNAARMLIFGARFQGAEGMAEASGETERS